MMRKRSLAFLPVLGLTLRIAVLVQQFRSSSSPSQPNLTTSTSSADAAYDIPTAPRPVLTLHIGPPKTGSTTLQCTLESHRHNLEADNVVYVGRPECPSANIGIEHKREFRVFEQALVTGYDCQQQLNDNEQDIVQNRSYPLPACWDEFVSKLEQYHHDGKQFIFSDEAMANRIARTRQYRPGLPYPWKALKVTLERIGWDVRILLVHRPLYDYLPSVYIEQYKDGPNKRRLRQWFGGGEHCPAQGGREVPLPFRSDTGEITIARLLEPHHTLFPIPAQVYELSQSNGYTTILVDMMDKFPSTRSAPNGKDLDFIGHIVCNELPGTVSTCKSLLSQANDSNIRDEDTPLYISTRQLNPSLSLNYDFIAVEACRRGLINGTEVGRDVARRAVQERQEGELKLSANDFPLICPGETTTEKILVASLEHERRIRKGSWSLELESGHNDSFRKKVVAKKKFCVVDSRKVLEDDGWVDFMTRKFQ